MFKEIPIKYTLNNPPICDKCGEKKIVIGADKNGYIFVCDLCIRKDIKDIFSGKG